MIWRASGFRAWLLQRLSAVYMALFIGMFVLHLALAAPGSYQEWRDWMALPFVVVTTSLFFAALLIHAWVGLRDVIMDYVRPLGVRFVLLALVAAALLAMGLWVLRILMMGGAA